MKVSLGVEMAYYFILLTVFVVFYSRSVVFLMLIALLGLVHLAAFQAATGRGDKGLQLLTKRRMAWVLGFDAIEVLILMALALQFYPPVV